MLNRYIRVRFEQEGFHRWPQAPKHSYYLSLVHRHIFKVEVTISVSHNNRDIEMHLFKQKCEELFNAICPGQFDHKLHHQSCEDMAEALLDRIEALFTPVTYIGVVVSEDGENDGIVEVRR